MTKFSVAHSVPLIVGNSQEFDVSFSEPVTLNLRLVCLFFPFYIGEDVVHVWIVQCIRKPCTRVGDLNSDFCPEDT